MARHDMEGLLALLLRRAQTGAGCDAELNAAYAEGRLRRAERRKLEAHLSGCANCRGFVTEWMMAEAAAGPHPSRWRAWRSWRWAAPALAGIVVVASAVLYHRPHRPVAGKAGVPAAALPAASPPAIPPAVSKPKQFPESSAARPVREPETGLRSAETPPAAPAPAPRIAASDGVTNEQARIPQHPQVAGAVEGAAAAGRREAGEQKDSSKEAPAITPGAPQAARAASRAAREGPGVGLESRAEVQKRQRLTSLLADGRKPLLPDGSPARSEVGRGLRLWAVSEQGRLFRSTDGGTTWQSVETPAAAPLVRVEWTGSEETLTVTDQTGRVYRIPP